MTLSRKWLLSPLTLCSLGFTLISCNSTDSERFNDQRESYIFDSTSTTLTAFGASKTDDDANSNFRCPSVSGMSGETSLTVFSAKANAPLPHFTLKTIPGIRSDAAGGIGISLSELPVGMLDIYQRCNSTTSEKYVTSCPLDYDIVDKCENTDQKECMLLYEGTHRLVISSVINDDDFCVTEESDRSPYATSVPPISYACDAFLPIPITAAYRGAAPINNCCAPNDQSTLDFCVKPCGCRELSIQIVPKQTKLDPAFDDNSYSKEMPGNLRVAVFSNVEGHKDSFKKLLNSIKEHNVDLIINLGNLTESGKSSQFSTMRDIVRETLFTFDGTPESGCQENDGLMCCETESSRSFTHTCNAILQKIPFLSSLGEDEYEGTGVNDFQTLFGPSNMATTIGKVQFIMLDTADASMSSAERSWLESVLKFPEATECSIPAPQQFEAWPTLAECRAMAGFSKTTTCRECIQTEAYCIPPGESNSYYSLGTENCICVPASSKICRHNQICASMDGTKSTCICTRDSDCGEGGTCVDGTCKPPIRLIFSYTPLFDEYGTRNNAFASKAEAASLLSLLIKSGINAIFSGRARDYSKFSMGGIPMYITGGGGAEMSSFSKHKHHWLLIDIPDAYTTPDADKMSVNVIEF